MVTATLNITENTIRASAPAYTKEDIKRITREGDSLDFAVFVDFGYAVQFGIIDTIVNKDNEIDTVVVTGYGEDNVFSIKDYGHTWLAYPVNFNINIKEDKE